MVYLVEAYRSRSPQAEDALGRVQGVLARSQAVRLIGRLTVPMDEIEFWLFDATARGDLTAALAAAGIGGTRISAVEELTLLG